jgi:hypothetical protein
VGGQRHASAAASPGIDLVPIEKAPEPVWTDAENLAATGIRFSDGPALGELLYRLSYPVPSAADMLPIFSDKPLFTSKGDPCTKSPAKGNDRSDVAVSQTGPKTILDCPGLKGQQETIYYTQVIGP